MRTIDTSRFAFVLWRAARDEWDLQLVPLASVPRATAAGAVLLVREDDVMKKPLPMSLQTIMSNSRRPGADTGEDT